MLRGLSSRGARPWRNFRMRRVIWGSSLSSSRPASSDSSTFQAMLLHHAFQRKGFAAAGANVLQSGFGQISVFEIFDVGEHSFAGVVGFSPPGALRQLVKALLDVFRQPDCKHDFSPLYTYSVPSIHKFRGQNDNIYGVFFASSAVRDRKSTRLNSSHANISYAVFC